MGSKYAQSEIRDTYRIIKQSLELKKEVLFSGTSCQIEGLKKFLNKEYENLICVDLICMGIPSNVIWKEYVKNFYNKGKIQFINFKDKTYGWDCFSVKVTYDKGKNIEVGNINKYMQLFFKGINIRPACYSCSFRRKNRYSDLTISDCWGIENFAKELKDNLGASTVMIHSTKGNKLFKEIEKEIKYKRISFEQAIKNNKYALETIKENDNRQKFYDEYKKQKFKKVINKYAKIPIKYKIRVKLRQIKRIILNRTY